MPGRNQVVVFGDLRAREKVIVKTAGGHKVVLDDNGGTVTITHSGGCSVRLTTSEVVVQANAQVRVSAPMVTFDSPTVSFSGVVKCDTLISQSVVSANYTPGAGNLW
jgi:phage baseplate assembly protein gpV